MIAADDLPSLGKIDETTHNFSLVVQASCECGQTKPDTLVASGYDQEEMDAAIDRARNEVDFFIRELMDPGGSAHAVKAPIEDGGEIEHFLAERSNLQKR